MSLESMAIALHHSRATGTAKLVLIGIANHDGDGGSWPAVSTLARYANVAPRNVQRALDTLEQLGEIKRIIQQGGDHNTADGRRPNLYRFLLQCPHDCDRTSRHKTARRDSVLELEGTGVTIPSPLTNSSPGDAGVRGRGDAGVTLTTHRTLSTQVNEANPSTGARKKDVCANGHEIVACSGGGIPFCALGCAPADSREVVPA